MYKLGKSALSHYIGSDCLRRLRLDLYPNDTARIKAGAPASETGGAGSTLLADQGHQFEKLLYGKLRESFTDVQFKLAPVNPEKPNEIEYKSVLVTENFDRLDEGWFLLEAEFELPDRFLAIHGLLERSFGEANIKKSRIRPDILQGVPSDGSPRRIILPEGRIATTAPADMRTGLRIIDVKMAEQPSPGHFVEIAFYAMTLASLLDEEGVSDRFCVLADAAIWPGKVQPDEDKIMREGSPDERIVAFHSMLRILPAKVVLPRVRSFLERDIGKALDAENWQDLPWHIGPSCRGCDYLGYRDSRMRLVEGEKDLRRSLLYRDDQDRLAAEDIVAIDQRRTDVREKKLQDIAKKNRNDAPIVELAPVLTVEQLLNMTEDGIERAIGDTGDKRCWSEAERTGELSRILEMSRAAAKNLRRHEINDIRTLAQLPHDHGAFDGHQVLRGARRLLVSRATNMLAKGTAEIPKDGFLGTSAVLPRRSDIEVYLQTEYDVGSKKSFLFGARLAISLPTSIEWPEDPKKDMPRIKGAFEASQTKIVVVENSEPETEEAAFLELMGFVQKEVKEAASRIDDAYKKFAEKINVWGRANGRGAGAKPGKATMQFYIWDRPSQNHLSLVVGRHLQALRDMGGSKERTPPFLWMVPPDQLLQDADFVKADSAITILSDVARHLVAAPLPHHYGLIGLANLYPQKKGDGENYRFSVDTLYFDPLSDQMPSERGHEMWRGFYPTYKTTDDAAKKAAMSERHVATIRKIVGTKLSAMASIRRQLADDLSKSLKAKAPTVSKVFGNTERLPKVSEDGQIVYQHARVLAASAALDVDNIVAMPPNRREAKGRSIRLTERLTDVEGLMASYGIVKEDEFSYFAFGVAKDSMDAKVKEGEFDWTFLPEDAHWMKRGAEKLSIYLRSLPDDDTLGNARPTGDMPKKITLRQACGLTIAKFDRLHGIVVFGAKGNFLLHMMDHKFKLDRNADGACAVLDPVHTEFFVETKLKPALMRLGNPRIAIDRPLFEGDIARSVKTPLAQRVMGNAPGSHFVWNADALHRTASGRSAADVFAQLSRLGPHGLNEKQQSAVSNAIERRLSIVWGPPGTGKSHTSKALLAGLILDAHAKGRPIRIAVTGPNWTAIDNLAAKIPDMLAGMARKGLAKFPANTMQRLRSLSGSPEPTELENHLVITGSDEADLLLERLREGSETIVVAGTADQLFRLANSDDKQDAKRVADKSDELFDFMLVDEASQMDLAHAIVAFSVLSAASQVTIVGDDLQMAPIHPVEAPEGCGHILGSIFDFYRSYRKSETDLGGIPRTMLSRNFRSNAPIVDFFRNAGYEADLVSEDPGMRMELVDPSSREIPPAVPFEASDVHWAILDPARPLCAILHDGETATQSDPAEADLVAELVLRLYGNMVAKIDKKLPDEPYGKRFFKYGVGIVTPHRAQQAAILERLDRIMPTSVDRAEMVAAVDTVERFQGQERTTMIASFGIGDVDQIAAEEEFLFSLNRFNVIASRATSKLIVLASRKMVEHLPKDADMLDQSALLKHYFSEEVLPTSHGIEFPDDPKRPLLQDCTLHFRQDPYPA
jgi:DNA replication ATP-dependent helicase Dna2